ncbi:hypothetical protein [Streptomyces sp. CAU 1734]|uniref:hypothetical protein n=1 Tax=Streptomyces sp. CAU 1734 TaxID=3140360 RepID=UPI00326181FA
MNPTASQRRLVADVLAIGAPYPLLLAGEYAAGAHGLPARIGRELDVVTDNPQPMAVIAATVRTELELRGRRVTAPEATPLSARLIVTDPFDEPGLGTGPGTGSAGGYTLQILKETLWQPPVQTEHGLVLSLEDVAGTRVRALAGFGLARDLIAVRAVSDRWSLIELEELGRRHSRDTFDLTDLQARLTGIDWIAPGEFAAYGVGGDEGIGALGRWAQEWADDIAERLMETETPED